MLGLRLVLREQRRNRFVGEFAAVDVLIMGTVWFPVNWKIMEFSVSFFGARIREERERLRLNQTAFSAIGGVTKKTQMLYESGERFPDIRYLSAIQEIGVDTRYIITGERDVPPPDVLSEDERCLLSLFRAAPLAVKGAVIGALHGGSSSVMGVNSNVISGSGNHISSGDMVVNPGNGKK